MSAYLYSGYPFDNVCRKSDHTDDQDEEAITYQYCNQDMFRSGIFPPLPRFQNRTEGNLQWMTPSQEKLVSLYGWTSVIALIVAIWAGLKERLLPVLKSLFRNSYEVRFCRRGCLAI